MELENKKPSGPGKSENEGIRRTPFRTREAGWPHPSLGRRSWPRGAQYDSCLRQPPIDGKAGGGRGRFDARAPGRAQLSRYPDFGPKTSLPPSRHRLSKPVALGVCSPLQWRNRPRFSRGSRTLSCKMTDLTSIAFKEQFFPTRSPDSCQEQKSQELKSFYGYAGFKAGVGGTRGHWHDSGARGGIGRWSPARRPTEASRAGRPPGHKAERVCCRCVDRGCPAQNATLRLHRNSGTSCSKCCWP